MSDFYSKITAPIVGDDPFGTDVNYDLDYDRLKNEMGKLGDIDTDLVETLSLKILTEKSKDARALAFLAYSMLRKGDISRLADVFTALSDYCRDNFENIYPRREKAKISALRWFSESRFSGQCEKLKVSPSDVPHTARLNSALAGLKASIEKHCPDGGPPLSLLYKRAAEWDKAANHAATPPINAAKPPAETNADNDIGLNNHRQKTDEDDDEYQEILQCLKKIERYINKLKNGAGG